MRICQVEAENVRIHQWQEVCLCVSCIITTNRLHAFKITSETSCHEWHYWEISKVTQRVHRDGFREEEPVHVTIRLYNIDILQILRCMTKQCQVMLLKYVCAEPINKCADRSLNNCVPRALCYNINGSYACQCPDPFIGDGYANGTGCK